jgi:hypothetical protein
MIKETQFRAKEGQLIESILSFSSNYAQEMNLWVEYSKNRKFIRELNSEIEKIEGISEYLTDAQIEVPIKLKHRYLDLVDRVVESEYITKELESELINWKNINGNTTSLRHVVAELMKEEHLTIENVSENTGIELPHLIKFYGNGYLMPKHFKIICDYFQINKSRYSYYLSKKEVD